MTGGPWHSAKQLAFQHEARHFAENLLAFMKTQLRAASHTLEQALFGSADDGEHLEGGHGGGTARCGSLSSVAARYRAFARATAAQFFLPVDGPTTTLPAWQNRGRTP